MAGENDVVLIYFEDKPAVFSRIESIEPDIKKDWYHVTLLLLTIPMQTVTWILRETYINGAPFTMGGSAVRLEEVKRGEVRKEEVVVEQRQPRIKKSPHSAGTIIPFKKP